jgi:hypothetical protein
MCVFSALVNQSDSNVPALWRPLFVLAKLIKFALMKSVCGMQEGAAIDSIVNMTLFREIFDLFCGCWSSGPVSRTHQRTQDFIKTRTFMRIF